LLIKSMKITRKKLVTLIPYVIIILYSLYALIPFLWMLSTSLKGINEIWDWPPRWIPTKLMWGNYPEVFHARPFARYTLNSVVISLTITSICIALGSLAGYVFSRFRFKWDKFLFVAVLATRIFPPISFITPWYIIGEKMGIIDTYWILIAVHIYMNLPFAIWIMRGFFDDMPRSLDEAGYVDGCTRTMVLRYIILPAAAPGLAATAIIVFLNSWNDYLLASIVTFTTASKTLPVGIVDFVADAYIQWNLLSSASIITCIPALIFILFFQKFIVAGLTAGSVKG